MNSRIISRVMRRKEGLINLDEFFPDHLFEDAGVRLPELQNLLQFL